MKTIAELVEGLHAKDNQEAYACLKALLAESESGNAVYPYFGVFAEMLDSENSYLRSRGILLIAANARWDTDQHMDECIDTYLRHTEDVKPITAWQCIQALPAIAQAKPDLVPDILQALRHVRTYRYRDTMQPLLQQDVALAIAQIEAQVRQDGADAQPANAQPNEAPVL
ncbi:MAG: SufBD protein [Candidatus Limiplasma sp.]|nr:SufBD protein [Candidatus Limiplasma sp.]